MNEKERRALVLKLNSQFIQDLNASITSLTDKEKVHILELLIETATRLEREDNYEDVYKSCIDPILITYKRKSNELFNRKLTDYFVQESLKLVDLIHDEKADEDQEQFLTDDEYSRFMNVAKNTMYNIRQNTYLRMTDDSVEKKDFTSENSRNKEHTARRRALFIHYLDKKLRFNVKGDKKILAKVAHFLTGNSESNLYKYLRTPLEISGDEQRGSSEKSLRNDLTFIKDYFQKLELTDIVKMIDKDMESF